MKEIKLTKWNDDTDAFDESERRSSPFRAVTVQN